MPAASRDPDSQDAPIALDDLATAITTLTAAAAARDS